MASWACPATSKTARIIVRIRNRFFIFSPCQNNLDFGPLELQELVLKCSALGTALGVVPGIGSAVIDWIVYGYALRTEKNPERFGHGDVRGVIAPESSNNAKEGGHLVPTIAFGIPAGASMTLLLGAFLLHGLTPGPDMLSKNLDVTYSIIWSLTLAHILGTLICLVAARQLAKFAEMRHQILLPLIMPIVLVATFQATRSWGDLYCLLFFGTVGCHDIIAPDKNVQLAEVEIIFDQTDRVEN